MRNISTVKFEADQCRRSYYQFFLRFWSIVCKEKLRNNWHIRALCDELQTISERIFADEPKEYDGIWNMPPGTTKSKIVSVLWQPWLWTRMPSLRFLSGSYSERLSLDLARQSRDCITSELYQALFPHIQLREDQNTKGMFMNTEGGWRFSTGVGGSAMGMHAHVLAIDDPIDPIGATSILTQDEANYWMKETLGDRKVDKQVSVTFLIMQRLHQNDPTGNWLERGGRIRHWCLPAEEQGWEVKPEDWRQFYTNGLLDPVRLSMDVLIEKKLNGEDFYAGQFGQNPVPRGGAMFKVDRFGLMTIQPKKWKKGPYRYWDKAGTQGGGAFTAGVKLALDDMDRTWVLDVVRGQWDSGVRERKIDEVAEVDGRKVVIGVEQEPGSGGKESAERTQRRLSLKGFRCKINRPSGDKVLRADPYSTLVNQGAVILLAAPWNHVYREELRFFPRGKYADQVDASSGCMTLLETKRYRIGAL